MPAPDRDYLDLRLPPIDRTNGLERMAALVEELWRVHRTREDGDGGFSWVGFYFGPGHQHDGAEAGPGEMILGPREPKPACSPIGLQGVCGSAMRVGRAFLVHDVEALGEGYIACDPKDRSELVIPLFDHSGAPYAVLDIDSFDLSAFTERDAEELHRLVLLLGLTSRDPSPLPPITVGAPAAGTGAGAAAEGG